MCNEQRECDINNFATTAIGKMQKWTIKSKTSRKNDTVFTRQGTQISWQLRDFKRRLVLKLMLFYVADVSLENWQMGNLQNDILEEYLLSLKKRVIYLKEAFLSNDLLDDVKRLGV